MNLDNEDRDFLTSAFHSHANEMIEKVYKKMDERHRDLKSEFNSAVNKTEKNLKDKIDTVEKNLKEDICRGEKRIDKTDKQVEILESKAAAKEVVESEIKELKENHKTLVKRLWGLIIIGIPFVIHTIWSALTGKTSP